MRALRYFLVLACGATLSAAAEPKHTYTPSAGYVPDAPTAIKIAVAAWEPIYGARKIAEEKPFHAALHRGVWTVQGSLAGKTPGGVAVAEISQIDGRILRVSHGK